MITISKSQIELVEFMKFLCTLSKIPQFTVTEDEASFIVCSDDDWFIADLSDIIINKQEYA